MKRTENPKMIIYIDGSVITRKKSLSTGTMIDDMEKRLLYVLHRLPGLKAMQLEEKVNYLKDLFAEKDEDAEGKGMQTFAGVLKIAEPRIVEKISKQFDLDLASDEKSFSSAIEKIDINIPNLYAICDLISSGVEDVINNDPNRVKMANAAKLKHSVLSYPPVFDPMALHPERYSRALINALTSGNTSLDERVDMLLECYAPVIEDIYKLANSAKERNVKLAILTQNDPIMGRVFQRLFPNIEVNVVPNEEFNYKRKNDPNLYGLILKENEKKYGEYIPHILVDDSNENIEAAIAANWESFYSDSKRCQNALYNVISYKKTKK